LLERRERLRAICLALDDVYDVPSELCLDRRRCLTRLESEGSLFEGIDHDPTREPAQIAAIRSGRRVGADFRGNVRELFSFQAFDDFECSFFAGALLTRIRSRARVGIVSNNLLEEQAEKLRHCGLDRFIDTLVVSGEAGVSKPDPRIFRIALDRLGCEPAEAVMIGDSWTADVAGARAAGIRAIWFNPAGRERPDASVPRLASLAPPDVPMRMIFDADWD